MSSILNSCCCVNKLCIIGFLGVMLLLVDPVYSFTYSFGDPLVDAAQSGDYNRIHQLLEQGVPVDSRGKLGATALMQATYHNNLGLMELLLASGANPDAQDIGGATSLHIAVRQGHIEAVRILLNAAANPNLLDFSGMTPIDYSINLNRTAEAYLLRNSVKQEEPNNTPSQPQGAQDEVIQELTTSSVGGGNANDAKYIGDDMPWLSGDSRTEAHIALEGMSQSKGPEHLHQQATQIAAAPVNEVRAEHLSVVQPVQKPQHKQKSKRSIKVHEAIKLPDTYDPDKSQPLLHKKLKAVPVLRAEVFGGMPDEIIAYGHMLSIRHPNKRFHNLVTKKGIKIYVTPFSNSMEVESWCSSIRDLSNKWRCKVVLPD